MNLGEIGIDRFLEIAALAAYLIVLLWIGLRTARQVRTSEDDTLAGRDVPWIVIGRVKTDR